MTLREYVWLNDLPIAVVNGVNTATPTVYYVHTDHLGRPARMVAQNWSWVWDVIYTPFGGAAAIFDTTAKLDMRFPGQWFQMESGLAYNWHRHYDATLGRYVQPDPLRVDENEGETIGGVTPAIMQARSSVVDQIYRQSGALWFGAISPMTAYAYPTRANYPDGPSITGYATQSPLSKIDPKGLLTLLKPPSTSSAINQCNSIDCGTLFEDDENECLEAFGGNHEHEGFKICAGNAWERHRACLAGKPRPRLFCDRVLGCM